METISVQVLPNGSVIPVEHCSEILGIPNNDVVLMKAMIRFCP